MRRELVVGICALLGMLSGCGVAPRSTARPSPIVIPKVMKEAVAAIQSRTKLPIFIITRSPNGHWKGVSATGFAVPRAYGVSIYASRASGQFRLTTVAPRSGALLTYSVIGVPDAKKLSEETILASYNLLGPQGLPPLNGQPIARYATLRAHFEPGSDILWWKQGPWLFVAEGEPESKELDILKASQVRGLPKRAGLFVSAPGVSMVDWQVTPGAIATIDGGQQAPRTLLNLVKSVVAVDIAKDAKAHRDGS